ncbi:MAG: hypothetical protein ABII19_02025, partial [Patescibacteria group bacterium]
MAKVEIIDSKKKIEDLVKKLAKQRAFVFNIEVEEKASFTVKLLGASFCFEKQKSFYVPCLKSEILNFKSILENSKIEKYGHDLKRNFEILRQEKIDLIRATFDTMIAAYLLNPGAKTYKLENLIPAKFGEKITPEEELTGKGRKKINLGQVAMEKISLYSGERAEAVWRLVEVLKEELRENELLKLFENLEMPLLPVLAEMEIDGVKIDARLLKKYSKQAEKDLEKISEKIFKLTKT